MCCQAGPLLRLPSWLNHRTALLECAQWRLCSRPPLGLVLTQIRSDKCFCVMRLPAHVSIHGLLHQVSATLPAVAAPTTQPAVDTVKPAAARVSKFKDLFGEVADENDLFVSVKAKPAVETVKPAAPSAASKAAEPSVPTSGSSQSPTPTVASAPPSAVLTKQPSAAQVHILKQEVRTSSSEAAAESAAIRDSKTSAEVAELRSQLQASRKAAAQSSRELQTAQADLASLRLAMDAMANKSKAREVRVVAAVLSYA